MKLIFFRHFKTLEDSIVKRKSELEKMREESLIYKIIIIHNIDRLCQNRQNNLINYILRYSNFFIIIATIDESEIESLHPYLVKLL